MSTRSEAMRSLVEALGWEAESDSTAGLVRQLSRMIAIEDGQLSVKEPPVYVAKVGKIGYTSIDAAIKAAAGKTVRLVADLTEGITIQSGTFLTIDLNDHSITASGAAFTNYGSLTVKGKGTVKSTGSYAVYAGSDSKTVIESGTYESVEGAVVAGKVKNAQVVINGGDFSASDNAVLASNGSPGYCGNRFVVNGGTYVGGITTEGYIACGIYCPNDDVFEVTGATFDITGGCGVCARAGKVILRGCTIRTTGDVTGKVGDSRVVVPCSALVFDEEAAYPALTDESGISCTNSTLASEVDAVTVVGENEDRIRVYGGRVS